MNNQQSLKNPYIPLKPHAIPPEAVEYLESLNTKERELHDMAVKILGSSYFVETSHGFVKWKTSKGLNK